jgi:hypothetical protein
VKEELREEKGRETLQWERNAFFSNNDRVPWLMGSIFEHFFSLKGKLWLPEP